MPSRNRNREITRVTSGAYAGDPEICRIDERQAAIRAELGAIERDQDTGLDTHGGALDALVLEHQGLEAERQSRIRQHRDAERAGIARAAQDPANRERGFDDGLGYRAPAAPARGYRRGGGQAGDGSVYRSASPWQDLDGHAWRTASMVERAHDVLESVSDDVVSRQAKGWLAELFGAESQEQAVAARCAVAYSDPAYLSAFRSYLIDPQRGHLAWNEAERGAWDRVATLSRAMTDATGSIGAGLPLILDPTINLTNAGSANPWRRLGTIKKTTSNTFNGVASLGVNAAWLAEGSAASDNSPTYVPIAITPAKAAAWVFGSYESVGVQNQFAGDVDFASQVGGLFADAQDRLEESTFATGAGTGAVPSGFLTMQGTGNDVTVAATGARAASDLYSTLEGVSPRFRLGRGANVAWLSSLTWLDKYRQVPSLPSGLTSVIDDTGGTPRAAGIPWYEESSMATGAGTGSRVLAVGDWSQLWIADRWPGYVVYEPMVMSTGSNQLPSGQAGWFYLWRSAIGLTTTSAWKVLRFT